MTTCPDCGSPREIHACGNNPERYKQWLAANCQPRRCEGEFAVPIPTERTRADPRPEPALRAKWEIPAVE